MRILFANHFPLDGCGSGTYTLNVASALVEAGHEVLVLLPDHVERDGYPFAVRVLRCGAGGSDWTDVAFNFPCFTSHPRSELTFGDLDETQVAAYIDAWQYLLRASVAGFRPDVIHANHVWIIPYVAARLGLPYVVTCHGTDLIGLRRWPHYGDMAAAGVAGARAVVAISHHIRAELTALFPLAQQRTHLIPNGFDPSLFRVLPDATKAEALASFGLAGADAPLIVFAGKLTEEKRADVLLRAAALYEAALPGAQTLLLGEGPLHERLLDLRDELGVRGVHVLGFQPQATLARMYNAADVCVFPSRCEPFGLVAIEAMACGAPVVVTNAGGFRDFVTPKVGALVPVDDPRALARAVIAEIRQGSKATKGAYAAEYALAEHRWQRHVAKLTKLYERAAS
jgi:glycosyltransferase involved in cell wall biosynthesis